MLPIALTRPHLLLRLRAQEGFVCGPCYPLRIGKRRMLMRSAVLLCTLDIALFGPTTCPGALQPVVRFIIGHIVASLLGDHGQELAGDGSFVWEK